MTIWEILIGAPATLFLVIVIILAIIGFVLLIAGFPFLIMNFYKNYKRCHATFELGSLAHHENKSSRELAAKYKNRDKISFWEILTKTYF